MGSIVRDGKFNSKLTDDELDRTKIIQQEHARDIDRALKVDFGAAKQTLPSPDQSSLLGWDMHGKLLNRPSDEVSAGRAEAAAAAAIGAASGRFAFDARADAAAASIPEIIKAVDLRGDVVAGDGLGGLFIDQDNGSADNFTSADGRTWYRSEDVGYRRLGSTVKQGLRPDFQNRHRMRIHAILPGGFPDAPTLVEQYNYNGFYDQGVLLDERAGQFFFLKNPGSGLNDWCWIEVRQAVDTPDGLVPGPYISCFSAGAQYNEGAVIWYDGSTRYLDIGMGNGSNQIGRYNVTTLPATMTRLANPSGGSLFSVPLKVQLAGRGRRRLVESSGAPVSVRRKYLHTFYDETYAAKGIVDFGIAGTGNDADNISGTANSGAMAAAITNTFPKSQGLVLAEDYIIHTVGGYWDPAQPELGYSTHGVKVFDFKGRQLTEALIKASDLKAIIEDLPSPPTVARIECEGGFITSDNRVFTLAMLRSGAVVNNDAMSRVIIEWFSAGEDSVDIQDRAVGSFGSVISPFRNGRLVSLTNPATGGAFTGLGDLLDYMTATDETFVQFAAANFPIIADLNGVAFPAFAAVQIQMLDNYSWRIRARNRTVEKEYQISGNPRVQTMAVIRDEGTFSPTLKINNASTGIVYSAQRSGAWKRTGDVITIEFILELTAKGSLTGNVTIDLPVAPASNNGTADLMAQGMAGLTSPVMGVCFTSGVMTLYQNAATGRAAVTDANLTSTSVLRGSFSYLAA
ncbi:hypothetical protein M0654_14130 [Rhizobium sp. NTR19]|uniref:Uncharacterized protein n=1 Tax=Neorhizobium turbinariae TaxID=2937795 RepID=A0ABT0ITC3_9HYPH|nr:hypothetical protein [Neorhizobium turbinariae]MCK8781121.1 hypothetical protein [Neorhizobium turbinariae]